MIILLLVLLVIFHAHIDANRIKHNLKIRHVLEGALYAVSAILIWYVNHLITGLEWYWGTSLAITTRAAWFDSVLNVFRGKKILYQGAVVNGIDIKKSIIDQIENKLGISIFWLRVIYIIIFLINTALFLIL